MATYKGINGFAVQSLASDPSPLDEGQVWYNNTSYAFKLATRTTAGTWSSSPNLAAASSTGGAAGTQTAALTFGLPGPPGSAPTLVSQSWNNTSWTTTPSLPRGGDYTNGFGTQTAAVSAGDGRPVDANYSNLWNGSSWTAGNPTSQYGYAGVGLGIQTAGMLASRYDGSGPNYTNYVELFNGTTWSNNPADLNTSRANAQGSGTQTAALVFGGALPGSATSATESYNGTTWTSNPTGLNTARGSGAGSGTQGSSVCYAGNTGSADTGATEIWNGSTWTNNPNSMNTPRSSINNTLGTAPATLAVGSGPANLSVESYAGPGSPVTKTITTS